MKISTSIKSLLLCAAAFTSFSAYAVTGSETEAGAVAANTAKDNDIVGICYTIPATHNPAGNGNAKGTMPRKGLKLRTGNDGNRLVFAVNAPYTITGIYLDAYSNDEADITITKVEVDGVEVDCETVVLPNVNAGTSEVFEVNGFNASESVAIYFDNSSVVKNKQILACYELSWTAPDPDAPTISGVKETMKLIPGATAQLSGKIDYPDAFTASWISEDESVATVDADGVVTAVAPGTTKVSYAWDMDQSNSSSCEVTVADFNVNDYELKTSYDFTTMGDIELSWGAQEIVGYKDDGTTPIYFTVWLDSNGKADNIFPVTNDGLTQLITHNSQWKISDGVGLNLNAMSSASRNAGIKGIEEGQVVEIIYTSSDEQIYMKGLISKKTGGLISAGDDVDREILSEGYGRAIVKALADGAIGFSLYYKSAIQQINVYTEIPGGGTGIESLEETVVSTGVAYDLMGRRAADKGLMIRDGKVIMVK